MHSNWILAVLFQYERKVPSRDQEHPCCLPTSALTEILQEIHTMGACLEDEALDASEGRTILLSNTASVHTQSPSRIADIMTG